jgi:hypothetical protein
MAINFPSTGGQATDGTFTYVAAGITYSWNGESWNAAGSGATATDRTVFSATTASAGSTSLSYNSNNGVFTYTPPDLSSYLTSTGALNTHIDVNHGTPSNGDLLYWNGPNLKWENLTPGSSSGLDADLLDGEEGSYYRNADNINTGTIGSGRLSGSYNISIGGSAASIPTVNDIGNASISSVTDGQTLRYDGSNWINSDVSTRRTIAITQPSATDGSAYNLSISGAPNTYALLKIETSHAAWVTLYTDTSSRTNDSTRSEDTDPTPGDGVIAEVITGGSVSQKLTPAPFGYSDTQNNTIYVKAVNKSGSTVNLQVTVTVVALEE